MERFVYSYRLIRLIRSILFFYRIRKGLSFKPSVTFLFPFVKRFLIQLKNLVIMANGFKRYVIFRFRKGRINR